MTGPPVILSFKKPIRVFDRVRRGAATSSGQSRTLAWPSLGHPSRAPRRVRCLCFPLPRSSDPPRAPRNSLAPSRGTSLSTAHRHAVDATPSNKDERRCKPARKLGPPSSARGANSSHKKYNQAWWFVEPWGLFLIRYVASHSTGFGGRSFTSADIPSSKTGTTVVSRYALMGRDWTCMAFWTSSLAFRAAATSAGSGAWTCAPGAAVFSRLRGVFHARVSSRRRRRAAGHVARVGAVVS